MTRPTDQQIRTWTLPAASDAPGSCEDGANEPHEDALSPRPAPTKRNPVRVYIDGGDAQDHWALRAFREGEEAGLIIDNTIAQSGREDRVFSGPEAEWLAELMVLTKAESVVLDPGGRLCRSAANDERRAESATLPQNGLAQASGDGHVARTLAGRIATSLETGPAARFCEVPGACRPGSDPSGLDPAHLSLQSSTTAAMAVVGRCPSCPASH